MSKEKIIYFHEEMFNNSQGYLLPSNMILNHLSHFWWRHSLFSRHNHKTEGEENHLAVHSTWKVIYRDFSWQKFKSPCNILRPTPFKNICPEKISSAMIFVTNGKIRHVLPTKLISHFYFSNIFQSTGRLQKKPERQKC